MTPKVNKYSKEKGAYKKPNESNSIPQDIYIDYIYRERERERERARLLEKVRPKTFAPRWLMTYQPLCVI